VTAADLPVFTGDLVGLQELLGGPPFSEMKLLLYCDAVNDLPLDALRHAIRAAARTATFFPKPAELRALALGDTADSVEWNWLLFRRAMREHGAYASLATTDPALGATVQAVFGGWPQACAAEFSPEMWTAKRKEFERVYRAFAQQGRAGTGYLPGLVEQQNGGRLEWGKYSTLAVIGATGIRCLQGASADDYRASLAALAPVERSEGWTSLGAIGGLADPRPEEPGAPLDVAAVAPRPAASRPRRHSRRAPQLEEGRTP
jgi:hypothetical protein